MLLERGADPNQCEYIHLHTPSFCTFLISDLQLMLKYGHDINTRGRSGDTLLHNAILRGNYQVGEFLLNNGAEMNHSQITYQYTTMNVLQKLSTHTPLQLAVEENHYNICYLLIQHGCNVACLQSPTIHSESLLQLVNSGDLELVKSLVYSSGLHPWISMLRYETLSHFQGPETMDIIWNWLKCASNNPLSLKATARLVIRQHFQKRTQNTSIMKLINALPIPCIIQKYIALIIT